MVKIGFICEGHTEKLILDSQEFRETLHLMRVEVVGEVMNVEGNGNLLPKYLESKSQILFDAEAEYIFILTDSDARAISSINTEIRPSDKHVLIIAVQKIEAWFLADSKAMQGLLKDGSYTCDAPESIDIPFDYIRALLLDKRGRGIGPSGGKLILANRMLNHHHFSIARAAEHPNCPSAAYFMQKLNAIANS
ncbi:hypothetical protein BH09BAC1_BH09BAC1_24250 [soil metagenome]